MEFTFDISQCSNFQVKSVKSLYRKFYEEKKNKLVLADEVGMGKTYVCKGLIENASKEENKNYTVFYISPNEIIAKQNHKELCRGFIDKPNKAVRLSELSQIEKNEKYGMYSFSASMFFSKGNKTMGAENERQGICNFVYSVFKCGKNSEDCEIKEWAEKNELYAQLLISAFFKPERRYWYWIDGQLSEEQFNTFAKEYKEWDEVVKQESVELSKEELKWCIGYLRVEVERTIEYLNQLVRVNDKSLSEIVVSQYALQNKRPQLNFPDEKNIDEKLYTLINKILIPYYCSDVDDSFYAYFNWYRKFMNLINFKRIKPSLIILDEFHKYFDEEAKKVLDEYTNLCPETRILFVSATPYKMSIKSEEFMQDYMMLDSDYRDMDEAEKEQNDTLETNISCFSGYDDLYTYISGKKDENLKEKLENIRKNLDNLSKINNKEDFEKQWKQCNKDKKCAEDLLKQYIVRTERHRLAINNSNYVETIISDCTDKEYLFEAKQFREINRVLQSPNLVLMYTKMAPYPLSFAQGYTSLGANEKSLDNIKKYDDVVFWDGKEEPEHFRYQKLKKYALPDENIKKLLWIPPSNVKEDNLGEMWKCAFDYTKTLVFARHIMTTKSIVAILSAQIKSDTKSSICLDEILQLHEEKDFMSDIFREALSDYCDDLFKDKYAKMMAGMFYEYLKKHQYVLINAGVCNKKDSLEKYCKDGCLKETLKEYFFLLSKEKNLSEDDIDIISKALSHQITDISYFTKDGLHEYKVDCNFAEMFNIDCKKADKLREEITIRFNSPFYPFVLATTPIAQEGINFQNYCHRILHWRLPVSPIDFEQREGRINRYRNHAVRKSLARDNDTLSWKKIFSVDESNSGLSPNWIANVENPVEIESVVVNHKLSKEEAIHVMLKKAINAYRISLGYGISKNTVDKIQEKARLLNIKIDFNEILIDLSPENNM